MSWSHVEVLSGLSTYSSEWPPPAAFSLLCWGRCFLRNGGRSFLLTNQHIKKKKRDSVGTMLGWCEWIGQLQVLLTSTVTLRWIVQEICRNLSHFRWFGLDFFYFAGVDLEQVVWTLSAWCLISISQTMVVSSEYPMSFFGPCTARTNLDSRQVLRDSSIQGNGCKYRTSHPEAHYLFGALPW